MYFKVTAVCADGVVRTATQTAEPDTFFSIPARVQAHGKTVSGSLYKANDGTGEHRWEFSAHTYRKNADVIRRS